MRFFLGLLLGLFLAVAIAAAAAHVAFGDLRDIDIDFDDSDRSSDVVRTLDVADFDSIDAAGVYEIEVSVGAPFSVEVAASPEEMERLDVRVVEGRLILDRDDDDVRRWRDNKSVVAKVSMPALRSFDASGVVEAEISGVAAEEFSVGLSGVGKIDVAGTCGALSARVSGVGEVDAEKLQCRRVDVAVSGVGEATVFASEAVEASVGGIGEITVYGSPAEVEQEGGLFSRVTIK